MKKAPLVVKLFFALSLVFFIILCIFIFGNFCSVNPIVILFVSLTPLIVLVVAEIKYVEIPKILSSNGQEVDND